MGHIVHMKKSVPINKHILHKAITLKEKIMISILRMVDNLWKLDFPSHKDKLRQVGLKLL